MLKPQAFIEAAVWFLLILAICIPRVWLINNLPGYLWSKDAGSYCEAVFNWLNTGLWQSDPRRGPVYSLLIAAVLKVWGSFDALMVVQHVLGGIAVLTGIIVLRAMHGAKALFPILACGVAYAVSAGPLSMEHLVRNETLLFVFASGALAAWYFALRTDKAGWLALAGLCAGLLSLTKNVFVPFPAMVIVSAVWLHRNEWRKAVTHVLTFCVALALPLLGGKFERTLGEARPPEPQSGILLFGRVAQFTNLDGGIEPAIKALIRPDIEDYRRIVEREGDLDNNIILKRTAVPRMRAEILSKGGSPADLNRLCRQLAIEAIRTHPGEYIRQVLGDFWTLHWEICARMRGPDHNEVEGTIKTLTGSNVIKHPTMRIEENIRILKPCANKKHFFPYVRIVDSAWLFVFAPVLLTSLLLPVLVWRNRSTERWFWIGCAVLWYFTTVLMSTVGKPMNRYMLPVTPIMFWALGTAVTWIWFAAVHAVLKISGSISKDSQAAEL